MRYEYLVEWSMPANLGLTTKEYALSPREAGDIVCRVLKDDGNIIATKRLSALSLQGCGEEEIGSGGPIPLKHLTL